MLVIITFESGKINNLSLQLFMQLPVIITFESEKINNSSLRLFILLLAIITFGGHKINNSIQRLSPNSKLFFPPKLFHLDDIKILDKIYHVVIEHVDSLT